MIKSELNMKVFRRLTITLFLTLIPISANADNVSDTIKTQLEKGNPRLKIKSILPTPISGLYEVFTNGQIVYVDSAGNYLLAGAKLVEYASKRNLTTERLQELTTIKFDSFPLKNAIKITKGNGAYKFAVFSDPDCPYCKAFEQHMEKSGLTDYTAYVFLMPMKEMHPDAAVKAENIWCAKDKITAWQNWMIRDTASEKAVCENPIAANEKLADELGVNGTPTVYLNDGKRMQSMQELATAIKGK